MNYLSFHVNFKIWLKKGFYSLFLSLCLLFTCILIMNFSPFLTLILFLWDLLCDPAQQTIALFHPDILSLFFFWDMSSLLRALGKSNIFSSKEKFPEAKYLIWFVHTWRCFSWRNPTLPGFFWPGISSSPFNLVILFKKWLWPICLFFGKWGMMNIE